MKKIKYWLPLVLVLAMLLAGCGQQSAPAEAVEETLAAEPMSINVRSALLSTGDTLKLGVTGGNGTVNYASSDANVASVDENGNVKALKKGNALITATSGDQQVCCGILVDAIGETVDLANTQAVEIFSDVQLYHEKEILGLGVDVENGAYYIAQKYAGDNLNSDSLINKVEQVDGVWKRTGYIHLYNNGRGYFSMEKEDDRIMLVTESNGVNSNMGTTISRVEWEEGKLYDEEFGDTYVLPEMEGGLRPYSDPDSDLVVVYEYMGRESYYAVYDRSDLFSGAENRYLHRFACVSRQTPVAGEDASGGNYNASIKGFAYRDGYLYQISGKSEVYISVFDLNGVLQFVHKVDGLEGLQNMTPGSIAFAGDELYIAMNTFEDSKLLLANVWKIEEVAE